MSIIADALKRSQLENPKYKDKKSGNRKRIIFIATFILGPIALSSILYSMFVPSMFKYVKEENVKQENINEAKKEPDAVSAKDPETTSRGIEVAANDTSASKGDYKSYPSENISYASATGNDLLTISGIMCSSTTNYAVINDKLLREGSQINGFTIKNIYHDEVIAVKNGKEYRMPFK